MTWLSEPMEIARGTFVFTLSVLVAGLIAMPVVVRARDERRIRALEFAERLQRQTASTPAGD